MSCVGRVGRSCLDAVEVVVVGASASHVDRIGERGEGATG